MRYWWVNQNQTFKEETRGNFMWSPKQRADGGRNQFYENMREVSPGDVVFSYCDTRIKAIGVVSARSQTGPKPDFGSVGANWGDEGWFVPVDFITLQNQVRPKDQGYITFSPNQELLIIPEVRPQLLDAWGIDVGVRVGGFSREQNAFLDYHRANVFQRSR